MELSQGIMKSLVVMLSDLLQNHILPPALPEQMAIHWLRTRKHSHCQRGVLQSLRLCHYVEQSHRIVSSQLLFCPSSVCLRISYVCLCCRHSNMKL